MSQPTPKPAEPAPGPLDWDAEGRPRSRIYGDVYFSADDGLAESRAVFLAGCGLPDAWSGRSSFTVGELGFGTGLNIAALLQLWNLTRAPGARLHIFSIEGHPIAAQEAARALAAWPELAPITELLVQSWPGRARGFHRIDLPELAATLDVAVMEATEALAAWSGAADAWFLDGFSPALNPDMWRAELMALVAARSAPGARAATYTVAGVVRRGLAEAGFALTRAPGHGRKRERLEGRLPGVRAESPSPRVAVVGAGIAGASLARAFGALGITPLVIDAAGPGSGGSGSPAGLMAPRLDAGLGPAAALFAQAARRALALYQASPGVLVARGAVQLAVGPKDPGRFAAIAGSDLFEPGAMAPAAPPEDAGEGPRAALAMAEAAVARPRAVLAAWLGETLQATVARLERHGETWRLLDAGGELIAEADVVCLAAALGTAELAGGVSLNPVRGQVSFTAGAHWPTATVFGAYVVPTPDGVLFGATHDRDDTDPAPRESDRARNLTAVAARLPALAARLAEAPLSDWSAIRASTRDYLPLAGPAPGGEAGLWLLTGMGSRGLCLAPLLAEHLAARIAGAPSPLPAPLAALVDPGRFAAREARRGRPRQGP